jgi:hypothetical protein
MALHRDIYWVGRQWAVTGYGVQACDQKQKGKFDIEASQLWADEVLESLRTHNWLNIEDFDKALSLARQRFPEPPRRTAGASAAVPVSESRPAVPLPHPKLAEPRPPKIDPIAPAAKVGEFGKPSLAELETVEAPKSAAKKFQMRIVGGAKFAHPWRIRMKW